MLDAETVEFLASGCALIVGTVGPDGEPFATRAWGATVLDRSELLVRVLLDGGPDPAVAQIRDGGPIAVTATSVRTFHSIQLKGRARPTEPATEADHRKAEQYRRDFFGDIVATDHTEPGLPPRLSPSSLVACMVDVEELYDQTPGPNAGTCLAKSST